VPAIDLERPARRRRAEAAWRAFVEGGGAEGVDAELARSWARARDVYRVDPALARAPLLPPDDLAIRRARDELFELAAPILSGFGGRIVESGDALAFLDADGWILTVAGDPRTLERLAGVGFRPGGGWREEQVGTSAPGTALAEGRPVAVLASEHYLAALHPWATSAAPIVAPGRDAPAAVVALAGPWETHGAQALVAATAVATLVEERLRAVATLRAEVIRYALRAARDAGDALVAVDARGRLLAANDAARRAGLTDGGDLPEAARERLVLRLAARGAGAEDEFVLRWPGAGEEARAVGSPVLHEGRAVGAILRMAAGAAPRGATPAPPTHRVRAQPQTARYRFEDIVGASPRLRAAVELATLAARNDLPVVLHGESGTGKELFAHGIHAASPRATGPFVVLNCGAMPATLIEAELFGYDAGTFTGGQREGKAGKVEQAHGGTLFLDEVSDLPPQAQTALLRVLQESEVVRLGGGLRQVDVRVVAATNRRLADEVAAGRFRQDLYFRLHVLAVEVPPLRDREGDVPLLARAFLGEAEARLGRGGLSFSGEALALLAGHPWPGNVRELRNVVLRAAMIASGTTVKPADVAFDAVGGGPGAAAVPAPASPSPSPSQGAPAAEALGAVVEAEVADADGGEGERDELVAALAACRWNIARTASSLGISRMTLYRRLRRFGITK
jgi:transcriptional regulator of acetoin/glycerol metabolism